MLISDIKDKKTINFFKKINKKIGKTINNKNLISAEDNVLVALSGGKDSMVLLDSLVWRLNFLPEKYTVKAVHIKLNGLSYNIDKEHIQKFCDERNVEFHYIEQSVDINKSDKTPCFICSHTRRKLLFETAEKLKCNKLAFGHHMDDAVETLMMNMIYHSNISAIPAKVSMFNGKFELIRPLIEIRNKDTHQYADFLQFPKLKTLCSFENKTKRKFVNNLLSNIEENYPQAINSIYASLKNIDLDYL